MKTLLIKNAYVIDPIQHISGETMRNISDPYEFLVISTWKSVEDWERWFANPQRADIEGKIDALLGHPTEYRVYSYD